MRPFVIITGDFVLTGGMDRANYALADYLSRNGSVTHLVAHRTDPTLLARPAVRFHAVAKPVKSYLLGSWPLAWAGAKVAREIPGCRWIGNGGNCRSADINWVHYVHGSYQPQTTTSLTRRLKAAFEQPLNRSAERAAFRAAQLVVCNSQQTQADVIRLGVRPERTRVVYYGTDPALFRPAGSIERQNLRERLGWPQDRPIVMFIGALGDRRKGFDTLFAAWAELCKSSNWDAVLMVVGRGAELPLWIERSRASGMNDRIQFLGFRSDVPDLLRAADLLVAPTRYEAYGLGVHEALCCGLPAIVSAEAGVAEHYPLNLAEWKLPDPNDSNDVALRIRNWRATQSEASARFAPLTTLLRTRTWDDMAADFLEAVGEKIG